MPRAISTYPASTPTRQSGQHRLAPMAIGEAAKQGPPCSWKQWIEPHDDAKPHLAVSSPDACGVNMPWAGSSSSGARTGEGRLNPATASVTVITNTQRVPCP